MSLGLATLVLVDPKHGHQRTPAALAVLGPDERVFLEQHVQLLRSRLHGAEVQRTKFRPASSMPSLLKKLQKARDEEFLKIADILAKRLEDAMATATRPKPGLLAVISTSDQQQTSIISILKLDATKEAARFRELAKGAIRLQVLRELLPSPEELQKGLSWPDPRPDSDAVILDRNLEAAKYFLNAYELDVLSAGLCSAGRADFGRIN